MMLKRIFAVAVFAASLSAVEPVVAAQENPASAGRKLFNSYCFLCHAADGSGGGLLARKLNIVPLVADLTGSQYAAMSSSELANRIGGYDRQQSLMPKWAEVLSTEQLGQLAEYVKRLGPRYAFNNGKNVYFRNCAACHGSDGRGGGAIAKQLNMAMRMPDLTSQKYRSMSQAQTAAAIETYSAMDPKIPDWRKLIKPDDFDDVVTYIRLVHPSGLGAVADAANGRAIFERNCAACHGKRGMGDGVLAALLGVPMVDYTSKSQMDMTDTQLVHVISMGKGQFMPSWFGDLNQYEIQDVAAYVRTLYKP
jgi:mono/diheme cytochrome c family protein